MVHCALRIMVWLEAQLLAPLIQMLAKRRIEDQLLILEELTGMEWLRMLWKYSNNHCAHQKRALFQSKGSSVGNWMDLLTPSLKFYVGDLIRTW